jgi:hypothetical protein
MNTFFMLIYNITIKVDWSIHEAWLKWMLDIHIPEVLSSGCFIKHQFVHLMEIDDTDGPTYALQLYVENKENYKKYLALYQQALNLAALELWSDHVLTFSTLMQVVH